MPSKGLSNPKTAVDRNSGSGLFSPTDKEFQKIRLKAKAVLEGRATWNFVELNKLLARILSEM